MSLEALVVVQDLPPSAEDITCNYIKTGSAALRVFQSFEVSGEDKVFQLAHADRVAQQNEFLSGAVRNPVLNNCPRFTLDAPLRSQQLGSLREAMLMHQLRLADIGEPSLEDKMAGGMIAQRLNELVFIESAAMIATRPLTSDDRVSVAEILKKTGRELYGMPDKAQALSDIKRLLIKGAGYSANRDHPLFEVAGELHDMVSLDSDISVIKHKMLTAAVTEYYRQLLEEEFRPALDYAFEEYPAKNRFTVAEMLGVSQRLISYLGYDKAGMQAVLIENKTMCATKQDPYVLEIGSDRPSGQRTRKRITETLVHEVILHGGRIYNGLQLGSGLAGYGLRRHEIFEEALAGTAAGIFYKKVEAVGDMQVMAITLAAGYDNDQDRDTRDCYEALWRLQAVKAYNSRVKIDGQLTKAQTKAYNLLGRVWRGMPTDIPGCVYTKDRAYDNLANVLPYLRGIDGPLPKADFLRLLQAKYDPTIADQKAYVESLTAS